MRGRNGAALKGVSKQTIDQTASELQLHHVLYLLKFLRALLLHVLLAISAAVLFFFTGINRAYPLANDLINALRAQNITYQAQDNALPSIVFWILVLIVSASVCG